LGRFSTYRSFDGRGLRRLVALLVNADGEVVCAKSMNRHPLAVKPLEERVSRLRFKPVKSKGEHVSAYGLLTLYVEYGKIRIR
jgi:hypothetical protein